MQAVRSRSRWIPAPPVPGSFVCNIGDMLDRMTQGLYRSTPHRVRNPAPRDRLSFPFFFDPNFFARVEPFHLPGWDAPPDDQAERWVNKLEQLEKQHEVSAGTFATVELRALLGSVGRGRTEPNSQRHGKEQQRGDRLVP